MKNEEIEPKVKEIVARQMGLTPRSLAIDPLTRETTFESLACDSLDAVEIAMDCEGEFGIDEIDDATVEGLKTVGDLIDCITKKLGR